jgi:hypothetical protein
MVAPDSKPEMEGRQRDRVPVYLRGSSLLQVSQVSQPFPLGRDQKEGKILLAVLRVTEKAPATPA